MRGYQRQRQLLLLTQSARVEAQLAERLRKVRCESVQRKNFAWLDLFDQFDQVVEIRVIAEREGGIGAVPIAATRLDRPARKRWP